MTGLAAASLALTGCVDAGGEDGGENQQEEQEEQEDD